MTLMIAKAEQLARTAHEGQKRKYTSEPYIVHPEAVACKVAAVADDPVMIAAAWLHDVVEDTTVTIDMIEIGFGHEVAVLVAALSNNKSDGNRQRRKALEVERLAASSPKAKTIKLADILDNVPSMIEHDPNFAVIYVDEKRVLLESLVGGDETLYAATKQLLDDFVKSSAISC